jgi:hypothetical protein
VAGKSGRGLIERLLAADRYFFSNGLLRELDLLVGVCPFARYLDGYEPVEIGMGQAQDKLARLTRATGLCCFSGSFTQNRLGEPESEPLFPDSVRSLEQDRLRQSAGGDGFSQPTSEFFVAV